MLAQPESRRARQAAEETGQLARVAQRFLAFCEQYPYRIQLRRGQGYSFLCRQGARCRVEAAAALATGFGQAVAEVATQLRRQAAAILGIVQHLLQTRKALVFAPDEELRQSCA
jgi:hypothetical protein